MEFKLTRKYYFETETIGELYVHDKFVGYTLEDRVRDLNKDGDLNDLNEKKIHGQTAIPGGKYRLVLSYSPRFKKELPEIINVKGFIGIRIHGGNTHLNTEGCVLVAKNLFINKPIGWKDRLGKVFSIKNWIQGSIESEIVSLLKKSRDKNHFINIIDTL